MGNYDWLEGDLFKRIPLKHYSYRSEEAYVQQIRRYIFFHNKRHPKDIMTFVRFKNC